MNPEIFKQEVEAMVERHLVKIDRLTSGNVAHHKSDLRNHIKAMGELVISMAEEFTYEINQFAEDYAKEKAKKAIEFTISHETDVDIFLSVDELYQKFSKE